MKKTLLLLTIATASTVFGMDPTSQRRTLTNQQKKRAYLVAGGIFGAGAATGAAASGLVIAGISSFVLPKYRALKKQLQEAREREEALEKQLDEAKTKKEKTRLKNEIDEIGKNINKTKKELKNLPKATRGSRRRK